VVQDKTTNYGTNVRIAVDASPETLSYLKFDLAGVSGTVVDAKLHLYTTSGNTAGYEVYGVSDTAWKESGTGSIRWTNRPPLGPYTGSSGAVVTNTWTKASVKSVVTGNGLMSLALKGTSTTAINFSSRQGTNPPKLVISTSPSSQVAAETEEPDWLTADSDGDGLVDVGEFENGTDPRVSDTDRDGLPDRWEIEAGLDARSGKGADGAQGDPDGDGFANIDEYNQLSDPQVPDGPSIEEDGLPLWADSDGDGLIDADELENGTNPNESDTDGDELPDLWEVEAGLNPRSGEGSDGAQGDPDGDSVANLNEYELDTDPQVPDSTPPNELPIPLYLPFVRDE
jgi:hypothetical protein